MSKELKITIPRIDFLKIASLLDDFGKMCEERGIKFKDYSEEQLLEILYAYKNYKASEKDLPPF